MSRAHPTRRTGPLFAGIVTHEGLAELQAERDVVARVIADRCSGRWGQPSSPGPALVEDYVDLRDRICGIYLHYRELAAVAS